MSVLSALGKCAPKPDLKSDSKGFGFLSLLKKLPSSCGIFPGMNMVLCTSYLCVCVQDTCSF